MNLDDRLLSETLDLAIKGSKKGDGGPFGALIVCNGEVIARGWNQVIRRNDPTAHAEIMAIRDACAALSSFHLAGCTLYASSEPCPMCLSAAYWARIRRVVFANSREVAAKVGFCDKELYQELSSGFASHRLIVEHHVLPDAEKPFLNWLNDPNRVAY